MRTSRLVPICIIFCIIFMSAQPVVYGITTVASNIQVFNEKHSVFRFEERIPLYVYPGGVFYRVNVYAVKLGNDYLLIDTGHEALFDDLKQKLNETFGKMPIAVLITHGHADHAGAGLKFLGLNVPVYAPQGDNFMIENGCQGLGLPPEFTYIGYSPNYFLPNAILYGLVAIATPGHTPGSVSFFDPSSKRLFSSDTTIIRPSDFSDPYDMTYMLQYYTLLGTPLTLRQMQSSSLEFLQTLKSIAIYPGHGKAYYKWGEVSIFIEESILLVQNTLP